MTLVAPSKTSAEVAAVPAGPLRRLGAMLYDTLLVIALLAVVTFISLVFTGGRSALAVGGWTAAVYRVAMLFSWVAFFVFFWSVKGRTLGMQVWRLHIERTDRRPLTKLDAANRLVAATLPWAPSAVALGLASVLNVASVLRTWSLILLLLVLLNYFAAWLDPQRRSLHDRLLNTRIVHRKS